MNENSLCHYGVLGMKWGIRKNRSKTSFSRKKKTSKKDQNKIKGTVGSTKKKTNVKKLSDSELQGKIRRLQLEKQYRDLKKDEVSAGKKLLGEILKTSGRTLGVQVANYVGGKAINKLFGDEVVKVGGKKKNKDKSSTDTNKTSSNTTTTTTNKKTETDTTSKNSSYNNSAYNNWYNAAQRDAYTRVMNDIFENYQKSKSYRKSANAVVVDVQDIKVSTLPALPASTKKRK